MDYSVIYKNHIDGLPPKFDNVKMKSKYYSWIKKQKLNLPDAEVYIKRILKELHFSIPEKITYEKVFQNPLITAAFWLYQNTTLTQKEISDIIGISTMTITNNLN
jgi:hypothetical protein